MPFSYWYSINGHRAVNICQHLPCTNLNLTCVLGHNKWDTLFTVHSTWVYTWSKVVWCTNRSNSLNSVPENHNVSNHMIKLLKLRAGAFTLIRYVSNNLFIIFTRVLHEHPLVNTNIYLKWILVLETWSTIHIFMADLWLRQNWYFVTDAVTKMCVSDVNGNHVVSYSL